MSDETQDWYFTFGWGQTHPANGELLNNCYVRIHGTSADARQQMIRAFGNQWCDQYVDAERAGVAEYGLREVPMPATQVSRFDPWQREDGFPSDEYFDAVESAFLAAGIHIDWSSREEYWEYNVALAEDAYMNGPLGWAEHGLIVSWRVSEEDEPKDADDFTGLGWYWVPYSKPQTAAGDFAKEFGLPYLAEPEHVAEAVAALVRGEDR